MTKRELGEKIKAILDKDGDGVIVFVKRKVYQFSIEKYTIILKKLMAF